MNSKLRTELTGSIAPSLQIKYEQKSLFAQNGWSAHHFPPFILTCFPGHGLKSTTETRRWQSFCRGREWVCADHIAFLLVFFFKHPRIIFAFLNPCAAAGLFLPLIQPQAEQEEHRSDLTKTGHLLWLQACEVRFSLNHKLHFLSLTESQDPLKVLSTKSILWFKRTVPVDLYQVWLCFLYIFML